MLIKNYIQAFLKSTLLLALPFVICNCNGTKQTYPLTKDTFTRIKLEPTFNTSARAKSFLSTLEKELLKSNSDLSSFIPSQSMIDEYSLEKTSYGFAIKGFLRVSNSFDKTNLNRIGIATGQQAGSIITVSIPIKFINSFISYPSIEYFEISEKVFQK